METRMDYATEGKDGALLHPRMTALRFAAVIGGLVALIWLLHDFGAKALTVTSQLVVAGLVTFELPFAVPRVLDALAVFALSYALFRLIPTRRVVLNHATFMGACFGLVTGSIGFAIGIFTMTGLIAVAPMMLTLLVVSVFIAGNLAGLAITFHLPVGKVLLSYGYNLTLMAATGLIATSGISYGLIPLAIYFTLIGLFGHPSKIVNVDMSPEDLARIQDWAKDMHETRRQAYVDPNYDRRSIPVADPRCDSMSWGSSSATKGANFKDMT